MSNGRKAKRARQKERRTARRVAIASAVRRRRRQRLILLGVSLLLIGGGVGVAYLARSTTDDKAQPTEQPDGESALAAPTPTPVACGAKLPKAAGARKKSYSEARDQRLDPDNRYLLRLETSCGDIEIELDVEQAPKTANSVAFLARERFYDGLVFHRNLPNFVVQGGDPRGDGSGGSGYEVVEAPPEDTRYSEGVVAMAKGGTDPPGTSGSQFFIVAGSEGEDLPAEYALLGKVADGMDVVEKIIDVAEGDPAQGRPPKTWVYIERATIIEE